MKIDYVVIGSDINPMYLDFWPVVSKMWKTIFNITPVLGLICNEDSDFIQDTYGIVKKFKTISNINTGLQSQIVRLFLPNILDGNILISDIDMLPLSTKYFINDINYFDDDKFYVMSSDNVECVANLEYPMCYNVSHSKLYKEILNVPNSWEQFVNQINSLSIGWTSDQRFLFQQINKFKIDNPNKIVLMNRGWEQHGPAKYRIDRINWHYIPELITSGHYIDCHMLRPYLKYKAEIDKLISYMYLNT